LATRERPADRGLRLGRAALVRIGGELRQARIDRGLSLDVVAATCGISRTELSRIERALSPRVPLVTLAKIAAVVGLDLTARLYPGASPLRDGAQAALLADFRTLVHSSVSWAMEVPLPIPRDQRAWDVLLKGIDWRFGCEAETGPRDAQALTRRLQLKLRDGGVDGVLLVLREGASTREFTRSALDVLGPMFPVMSRDALASLRLGRRPDGNAIVVVPRRSRLR
jgi:transcriptional regulator with XRE-family HTH domain